MFYLKWPVDNMTDIFTPEKRSWIMGRVKGKDTKPELLVRSIVHQMGFRFRLHRRDLPGAPDLVLPKHRKVIFVHGCFWHGHKGCRRSTRPTSNKAFWRKKLDSNIKRDRSNIRNLKKNGWKPLIVWGCEVQNMGKLFRKLSKFLRNDKA